MKLKNLFFAALAVLGAAVACKQEETVPAGISVDVLKIEAPVDGTTVKVQVTSSEEWIALVGDKAKDWLHVLPASGPKGTSTITITVDELEGKDRKAVVSVATKMLPYAPAIISVTQKGTVSSGDGKTPETAFSASEAYAWVMENIKENNAPSDEKFYVKGYIHKIGVYKEVEQYFTGNTYGNATFYISDSETFDSSTEKDFEAYQVNYLGNRKFDASKDTDIKIGDAVIIYGYLTKYNSTAETMQQNTGKGAYIYSLNGVVEEAEPEPEETKAEPAGEGTEASPYNVSKAIDLAKALTYTSSSDYQKIEGAFIKGKIAKIDDVTDADLAQYGNRTYYIADEGYTAQFYVYRGLNLGNTKFTAKDQIKVGDEVVITGTLMNFKGNSPQLAQGNYLVELNGQKAEPEPEETKADPAGEGTEASPYNVSKALDLAQALTYTSSSDYQKIEGAFIKGKIAKIDDVSDADLAQYGNRTYYIVDEGYTAQFYVYRGLNLGNAKFTAKDQIKVGDEVVITGTLMNFKGNSPQLAQGNYLVELNGEKAGDTPAEPEVEPAGTGTEADPFNIAAAIAKAVETGTTPTEQEYYIKGIVNADATPDSQYKNASLDLVDEGSTKVFKAFRIYSFGGVQFLGTEQFKKGDVVVVLGKIVNYSNSVPETQASSDYRGTLISVNGETSFGPSFAVASKEIAVSATATEATVSVLSNVAWTAASTATIDKAAGEGSADIKVTFPANTDTENTKSYTVTLTTTADVTEKEIVVTITQGKASSGAEKVDVLDNALTGITGSNYASWSGKAGTQSPAVYAGQSAGSYSSIQLRSNNNNSGVISTTSGGTVTKVVITWNSNTAATRTLSVYGSNTAYTDPADLYGNNKGTLLGDLNIDNATSSVSTLTIEGSYTYVGLRSKSGAMYIDKIEITWE